MRCNLLAIALSLGVLSGCSCFEPVDESTRRDAGGTALDAGATFPDAGSPSASDAGDPFCSGDVPRVRTGTGDFPVAVTSSLGFLDCCDSMELVFHTGAALGSLGELSLRGPMGQPFPLAEVALGDDPQQDIAASLTIGASYFGSGISQAANRFAGTVAFSRSGADGPTSVRVCLTLDAVEGEPYDGVRFFAPAATVMPAGWEGRFALYLLADASVDSIAAAKVDLANLALEDTALLDLFSIRYYRAGDHFVALGTLTSLAALQQRLGTVPVGGRPFVVVADGARLYLGAFWSPVSSFSPVTPYVATEAMTGQGFAIAPPPSGADPRADARALAALSASGKLAP